MKTRPRAEEDRQKLGTHLRSCQALRESVELRRDEGREAPGAAWAAAWHVDGPSPTGKHPTGRPGVGGGVVVVVRGVWGANAWGCRSE